MGKKQHFVPQFLLRNFSSGPSKRNIDFFYLPQSRIIRGASIKGQAYGKKLYSGQKELEEYLSLVEREASFIIRAIIQHERVNLGEKEDMLLKHFVSLQLYRTPEKTETIDEIPDKFFKTVFRDDPRIKGHINDFGIRLTSPYLIAISHALNLTPLLFDLRVSLLLNNNRETVLLGQHPAIITNQFLYEKKWIGSRQGIGNKGVIILLPISPRHVLALYDRERYGLVDFVKVGTLTQGDVTKINLLQFCYTTDCVYFYNSESEMNFDEYKNLTEEFREGERHIMRIFDQGKKKGGRSELIWGSLKDPPVAPAFSFLRLTLQAIREKLGPTMDVSREWVKIWGGIEDL